MPSKAALVRATIYATCCAAFLVGIAMIAPPDLLSVPVYAFNGSVATLFGVWMLLRRPKDNGRNGNWSGAGASNPDQRD